MNALLMALALAAAPPPPTGLENPPQYDVLPNQLPSGWDKPDEPFSAKQVVDKLHHVNEKNVEYGSLAQKRGGNEGVRKFGAKLVKDHQALDKTVLTFAKANKIELGTGMMEKKAESSGYTAGQPDDVTAAGSTYGTPSDSVAQAGRNDGTSDFDRSGSIDKTGTYDRTGVVDKTGTRDQTGATDRTGATASTLPPGNVGDGTPALKGDNRDAKRLEQQAKLDELRNLQGSEFDTRFLANVIDSAQRSTEKLTLWKGQGDKKLDGLINNALKVIGDHEKEARKLQQRIPAA